MKQWEKDNEHKRSIGKPELFPCPYNEACVCCMDEGCFGCEDFKPGEFVAPDK